MATAVIAMPTPAAAAGGSATDWMHQGKFGVMEHYLAEGCAGGCDPLPSVPQWNERVNNYDVPGVVNQLKSIGAGWLQISVGQNTGFYAAPNATYDQLVPPTADHPSRLTTRDLIKDLGAALHQEGIKLIVYITSDAIQADHYARHKLSGDSQESGAPNATYQENWLKVVQPGRSSGVRTSTATGSTAPTTTHTSRSTTRWRRSCAAATPTHSSPSPRASTIRSSR